MPLALAAVALYASSWSHGFVGDDSWVTWSNAWINEGLGALPQIVSHSLYFGAVPQSSDLYRPVAGVYFAFVGVMAGHTASGYHVANTLLYGLDVAALFVFLCSIADRSVGIAAVATVVFIVHPIHTEVVDNIKSADEMLCLLFLLLSFIAWLRQADEPSRAHRAAAIGFYALALGSKETAVPMLVIFPALWWWFRGRPLRSIATSTVPFVVVAVAFLIIRARVLGAEPSASIVTGLNNSLVLASSRSQQLASAFGYVARYTWMLVWPHPLSFDYTYDAVPLQTFGNLQPWVGILICAGVCAALVSGWARKSVPGFAALWMAAGLILVSNLLFLVSTNFGERLLYLPSVMACDLFAWALARSVRVPAGGSLSQMLRRPIAVVVVLVVLVSGTAVTVARSADWTDEATLFAADLATFPNSARLNNFVGSISYFAGERVMSSDPAAAAADFTRARDDLRRGLVIGGREFLQVHAVLGMAEYQLKDCVDALPHLRQAMSFTDYRIRAMEMMGDCYEQMQDATNALDVFRQLDAAGVAYPHGWFQLGNDAAAHGDDAASVVYFKKVIDAAPDNVSAFVNLALGEFRLNRFEESLDVATRCLALQTAQVRCLVVAAEDEGRLGHPDKAAEYVARARAVIK